MVKKAPEVEDGTISAKDGSLDILNADTVTFYIAAATDYNAKEPLKPLPQEYAGQLCRKQLEQAMQRPYDDLFESHIAEHQRLFGRVQMELGSSQISSMPTDQRLEAVKNGGDDAVLKRSAKNCGRWC
ncbi:MAG: hypothetical protein DRP65_11325 [Planctomycetota bacterium]|nr:MAG: hypothetical protein DRP65_11325 [Planctomycetota bacterium]